MTVEGLEIRLAAHGLNVRTISAWMADEIAVTWEPIWTTNHPEIRAAYERIGEPAYGIYNRELFRPVQRQLDLTGMTCSPRLPGTLPLSEEEWGAEDHRERRMWTLLLDGHRAPVGAIVTRFFHDHTRLRLPQPPTVVGLTETDHDRIRALVLTGGGPGAMSEVAQDRRTYLVTGATSGIGLAITSQLAAAGHRVIIGARSEQRGDAAALRVRECTSEARLDVVTGDLANMSDVSKLALQVRQLTPQVDGLILNAAVSRSRPEITAEGYEINFATNYLAGFWLTHLLMATLMAAHQPRVIALASSQHTHVTELDVSTLGRGEGVEPRHLYVTTKLLDILFVTELARRTKETGLTALAADPGFVRTDLGRDLTGWMALLLKLTRPIQNSPDIAARTPVHLATSPDVGALSGGYFSKSKPARCSPLARDPELAHRLWEHTSRLLAIPS